MEYVASQEGKKKEDARVIRFISGAFSSSFFNQLSPIHNLTRYPITNPKLALPTRSTTPPVGPAPSSRRRQQHHHHDHRHSRFLILPFLSIPTFYPQPHNHTIIPAPTPDARRPSPNPRARVRTMAGDHKCPVCGSTFTRSQHVARHMRSRAYTPLPVQLLPPPPITSYF